MDETCAEKAVTMPGNRSWKWLVCAICLFSVLSLYDLPESFRPAFLTAGVVFIFSLCAFNLAKTARSHAAAALLAGIVLLYWAIAFPAALNGIDDNAAYLIFAREFYHSLDASLQPLSERRLFSVGGLYAFQAPVLAWIGPRGMSLVEPVLGLAMIYVISLGRLRDTDSRVAALLVGMIGLTPLAGSLVLANTASSFTLAAFTLALLELSKDAITRETMEPPDIVLAMLVVCAAALFRPTTAPFNLLILGGTAALFMRKRPWTIALSVLLCGLLLYPALLPYNKAFGTFLYPLLGKGGHISAEGLSIAGSIPLSQHIGNVLRATVFNPLFLAVAAVSALIWASYGLRSRLTVFTLLMVAALAVFSAVIAISTGGLAAARYIAPVTIAALCSLLLSLAPPLSQRLVSSWRRPQAGVTAIGIAVVMILGAVFLTKGEQVAATRLKAYNPAPDQARLIREGKRWSNKSKGTVLLVGMEEARFIVSDLNAPYLIMDQPGMLSPSSAAGAYGERLARFIKDRNVRTILMPAATCAAGPSAHPTGGWASLALIANERNAKSICGLTRSARSYRAGKLLVVIVPNA